MKLDLILLLEIANSRQQAKPIETTGFLFVTIITSHVRIYK